MENKNDKLKFTLIFGFGMFMAGAVIKAYTSGLMVPPIPIAIAILFSVFGFVGLQSKKR